MHTYIAGGLRVHNDCVYATEVITGVGTDPLFPKSFYVDLTDQITGEKSTITHTLDPATGALNYVQRDTYFGAGTNTFVTNGWSSFDASGNVVGSGNVSLTWRNTSWDFGPLGDVALRERHTIIAGIDTNTLEWVDSSNNPVLTADLKNDPLSTAAESLTITDNADQFSWSNKEVT